MKPKVSYSSALLSEQCKAIIQMLKEDTGYYATLPAIDPNAEVFHAGQRSVVNKLILARRTEEDRAKRLAEREANERPQ